MLLQCLLTKAWRNTSEILIPRPTALVAFGSLNPYQTAPFATIRFSGYIAGATAARALRNAAQCVIQESEEGGIIGCASTAQVTSGGRTHPRRLLVELW
jgi:hypothetical protein